MRIAIDARMMGAQNTRGIGRYIEEMIRAFLDIAPEHQYILFEKDPSNSPLRSHPSIQHEKADVHWYGIAEQILIPKVIRESQADILHVPHWNVTWSCPIPRIVTIHDLILLEEPTSATMTTRGPLCSAMKRFGFLQILRRALYRSQGILVPAAYTEQWIRKHYPDLTTPITVTGEGMPDIQPERWKEPDMDEPYFFMIGSAYPHKNHQGLLRAWAKIASHHPHVTIRIAGKTDTFMRRLKDWVQAERIPNVTFLGEVSDDDLPNLYAKSLALLFPSRWEGFGLPPLEAVAYGSPVCSSDRSCLPEVLGNEGVVYFNPDSADAIIHAIETVLSDPSGIRGDARRAAPKLKERHDWRVAASRTLRAYEEVVRSNRHAKY